MDKRTFINQVAHLFRGQVLYALTTLVVVALLAKFGGDGESGRYVLALATTAPIFLLFDLNLRVSRSTDHQHNEQYRHYVALRFLCLIFSVLVTVIVCSVYFHDRIWVFLAMIVFRVGDSISNLAFGGYQRMQVSDLVGKSLTYKALLSIAALLVVIPLTGGNAVVAAMTMGVISITWALLRDLPQSWKVNEPDYEYSIYSVSNSMKDVNVIGRIARRSLPLGIDASISSLSLNAPRYAIEFFFGTNALGVFGLLSQLAFSIQMLIGAVGHAGVPVLAKHRVNNNRKQFWRLMNRMLATSGVVGLLAVIGGTLVIPPVMGYFLGPQYNNVYLVMCLIIASALTGVLRTAGRATQACGSYFTYTMFDVVVFVTSAVASIILVKHYQLTGGAIALICSFACGMIVAVVHTYFYLWPTEEQIAASEPNSSAPENGNPYRPV